MDMFIVLWKKTVLLKESFSTKFSMIRCIYQGGIEGLTSLVSHLSGTSDLPCLKPSVLAKVVSHVVPVCCCCSFKGVDKPGSCYSVLSKAKLSILLLLFGAIFGGLCSTDTQIL